MSSSTSKATLRILHTADWHLGHSLSQFSREPEHRAFLDWLLDRLEEEEVDALIMAGDIFDTANPSAAAQALWYGFLSKARARMPQLDIVAIGGNHDSAARLDAPKALLDAQGIAVVGGLPRNIDGSLDTDRLLVPLRDRNGAIAAWTAAVPFLRTADLPRLSDAEDPLIAGVRAVYDEALAAGQERCEDGQALIAMGHCYMTSTRLSELSERRILGGNQHALPVDLFGDAPSYVALGHLHLPQKVGAEHVRYSGSPIPLSLSERGYHHQVRIIDFDGAELCEMRSIKIPRRVEMLRVPEEGSLPLDEILPLLQALPSIEAEDAAKREERSFLSVHVRLPEPQADLGAKIRSALEDRAVRLARLAPEYTGTGRSLGDVEEVRGLSDMQIEDVFRRCWEAQYEQPPDETAWSCFRELLEVAAGEDA